MTKSSEQLQAEVEVRALREEANGVQRNGALNESDRAAKLQAINMQILIRGGEPLEGVALRAVDADASQRRTTERAPTKRAAPKRKPAARKRKKKR